MPAIPFVKVTACGNDFLIIPIEHAPPDIAEFTRRICDRHNGVGADGVEWVMPATDADVAIRLINSDGSPAEISGNGTRCVAAWFCSEQERDSVVIRTDAGIKTCELMARFGQTFEFRTSMGEPKVLGERTVQVGERTVNGVEISMGNPHFAIVVEDFESGWQLWSQEISVHPDFAEGTNVELVRVNNDHEIEVRFCERGVGETMSSGTGSSAAAVASIHLRRAKSPVQVLAPGGAQTVEWDGDLRLYGPATILCHGEFFI
jgi:diaminopimelate epimerase